MVTEDAGVKKQRRKRRVPDESKRSRFVRLAEARTEAACEKIRILSNLSNPVQYDFTADDIAKIFQAIEDEVNRSRSKFESSLKTAGKFSLEDVPRAGPE